MPQLFHSTPKAVIMLMVLFMCKTSCNSEISKLRKTLEDEQNQKKKLEGDIAMLQSQLLQLSFEADEVSFGSTFLDFVCAYVLTRTSFIADQ